MGKIADDLIDMMWDNGFSENDFWDYESIPLIIKCKKCNKSHLLWKKIDNKWILFEKDKIHICGGYEPPIDILKKLACEIIKKSNVDKLEKIKKRLLNYRNLSNLLGLLSNEEVMTLYDDLIRSDETNKHLYISYDINKQLKILKNELLRRLNGKL